MKSRTRLTRGANFLITEGVWTLASSCAVTGALLITDLSDAWFICILALIGVAALVVARERFEWMSLVAVAPLAVLMTGAAYSGGCLLWTVLILSPFGDSHPEYSRKASFGLPIQLIVHVIPTAFLCFGGLIGVALYLAVKDLGPHVDA